MRWFISALLLLSIKLSQAEVPAFEAGDRVTFIGDSITHGGSYHSNLYLYYATRFPNHPFVVYNCGIAGDTTPGTNRRFKQDIKKHNPNVASVMLGMNDAWGWCFSEEKPTQAMLKGREDAFKTYSKEMRKLLNSLKELNCRIILIKPSIFDETAKTKQANNIGKNAMLGRFGAFLEEVASEYNASIVDFYSLMLRINTSIQKEDPTTSIVGHDRVHPGDPGHFVMSYAFLKAQDMPSLVSAIHIDASAQKILFSKNCHIAPAVRFSSEATRFIATEKSLPFPVTDGQAQALNLLPFQADLNQQILQVSELNEGLYDLKIDNVHIGSYSAKQLASGINLSNNKKTPQYKQALQVKFILDQKLAATDKLRAMAHVRHMMLSNIKPAVSEDDPNALKLALEAHVKKAKGKPWHGYLQSQVASFLEALPNEALLLQEEEDFMQAIWLANQPTPHIWTLTPKTP